MNTTRALSAATLSTIVCLATLSAQAGESFTSAKFLTYPADAQRNYISTSVVAATVVVSLNSKKQADCLGKWLTKHRADGYASVLSVMRKYPNDHPTGLVISVLQRDCGAFKYSK